MMSLLFVEVRNEKFMFCRPGNQLLDLDSCLSVAVLLDGLWKFINYWGIQILLYLGEQHIRAWIGGLYCKIKNYVFRGISTSIKIGLVN